jgi:hypothetical protein
MNDNIRCIKLNVGDQIIMTQEAVDAMKLVVLERKGNTNRRWWQFWKPQWTDYKMLVTR